MRSLRDAVGVVTGAGSGIGPAVALELANRGCALALADRDEAGLAATREAIGSRARSSARSVACRCW